MSTLAGQRGSNPAPAAVQVATGSRRRRPSGEPPPLPRRISRSTGYYAVAVAATIGLELAMAWRLARRALTNGDDAVLRMLAALRSEPLTHVMRVVQQAGSLNVVRVLGWVTIALLLMSRRFRH